MSLAVPSALTCAFVSGSAVGRIRWHDGGMALPQVAPVETPEIEEVPLDDRPWVTIVWDDPVNLMSYVTWVFQKLFGYSRDQAEKLMLDVHNKGKAVVSSGAREKMELDAAQLHGYGLWATVDRD
jgi:ATP-dependent Clp protease adaptor protein ClpS